MINKMKRHNGWIIRNIQTTLIAIFIGNNRKQTKECALGDLSPNEVISFQAALSTSERRNPDGRQTDNELRAEPEENGATQKSSL